MIPRPILQMCSHNINSILEFLILEFMTGVLQQADPFIITFGKQNWNNGQLYKQNHQGHNDKSLLSKAKRTLKKQDATDRQQQQFSPKDPHAKRPRGLSLTEKQNLRIKDLKQTKSKRRHSIFDNEKKSAQISLTFRQQFNLLKQGYQPQKLLNNHTNPYNIQLNKKLKLIETASKGRKNEYSAREKFIKAQNDHQNSIFHPNYKCKNLQAKKENKPSAYYGSKHAQRQQMYRIDGLIEKINTRIKALSKNHA